MIPRLSAQELSFQANEKMSPRESYDALMTKNNQTAQKQNNIVVSMSNQIPMQGAGQKLDVIA